jgi:hypothetical protein
MLSVIGTGAVAVIVQGCALAALRMRLHGQQRRALAHHRYLLDLARTLPRGSRLDERGGDGSVLHLVIPHDHGQGRPR